MNRIARSEPTSSAGRPSVGSTVRIQGCLSREAVESRDLLTVVEKVSPAMKGANGKKAKCGRCSLGS